jgi:hypothetical protein
MYTKIEMGQRLQSLLYPTTTPDSKLTIQEAMKAVSEARDEVIRMGILGLKAETNIVLGNWLSEFTDVEVRYDSARKKYYTELPCGVIALPNDQGVYHVYFNNNDEDMFIPVTPAMRSMYRGSLAQYLEGDYGYFLLENKIWYTQSMPVDCKVSMNLIAQSGDLGEYDYFPIDGSLVQSVLERAAQLLGMQKQVPQDITNNNISE